MRRRVTWLLVPLAWALGCGGRFEQTPGDGEPGTTSTGQGGSAPAKAGSASSTGSGQAAATGRGDSKPSGTGAATASGGAPIASGGTATAGTFTTGGTFAVGTGGTPVGVGGTLAIGGDACEIGGAFQVGGDSGCPPPDCIHDFILVRLPNGLYTCQPPSLACDPQRKSYLQLRQQLLDKYSTYACSSNADCTIYYEKDACGVSSCGIPIAKALLANLDNNLNSYAQMGCNPACPPTPQPPCDAAPPECFNGYCN